MWIHLLSLGLIDGAGGQPVSQGKSHADVYVRQILTDYYTKAFEKKVDTVAILPQEKSKAYPKKKASKVTKPLPIDSQVENAIAKALPIVVNSPYLAIAELIDSALQFDNVVYDFRAFESEQRYKREQREQLEFLEIEKRRKRQQREDDDLLMIMSIL